MYNTCIHACICQSPGMLNEDGRTGLGESREKIPLPLPPPHSNHSSVQCIHQRACLRDKEWQELKERSSCIVQQEEKAKLNHTFSSFLSIVSLSPPIHIEICSNFQQVASLISSIHVHPIMFLSLSPINIHPHYSCPSHSLISTPTIPVPLTH